MSRGMNSGALARVVALDSINSSKRGKEKIEYVLEFLWIDRKKRKDELLVSSNLRVCSGHERGRRLNFLFKVARRASTKRTQRRGISSDPFPFQFLFSSARASIFRVHKCARLAYKFTAPFRHKRIREAKQRKEETTSLARKALRLTRFLSALAVSPPPPPPPPPPPRVASATRSRFPFSFLFTSSLMVKRRRL